MDATFAEMVDEAAKAADLNDYQLSAAIGLLPGHKVFSAKQIGRLRRGEQRTVPAAVLWRLVEVLDLDPVRAWKAALVAADMLPPQLTAEQFEELRTLMARPSEPALARVGGSDPPLAASLRKATTTPTTKGRRRDNSCFRSVDLIHAGQRRRRSHEPVQAGHVAA
jgi:transcriptional regulator with XRE-family HTH domain